MVRGYLETVSIMTSKLHRDRGLKLAFFSIEDFILKNGRAMGARSEESQNYPKGKMKECFKNAMHLAIDHGLVYCEGFATTGILPVHHAWCLDKDGNVIDITWNDGIEYFGVKFNLGYVTKTTLKRGAYGIIDNWEMNFPLLHGEKEATWKYQD